MFPPLACTISLGRSDPKPMPRIAFRAFKAERQLEIWGATNDRGPFRLLAAYPIAAVSGTLGPKRREGDMQAPEGFYRIDRFNPHSLFHLSLGLNYPNSSDRRLSDPAHPGEDIFIHGNHVSAGCLAMTDPVIDKIYALALNARNHGQRAIPVSIFPCRLTDSNWAILQAQYARRQDLVRFWSTLRPGYTAFERTHIWPRPHVDSHGNYVWPRVP
jgi:murein L,D-transpeptidase YafK